MKLLCNTINIKSLCNNHKDTKLRDSKKIQTRCSVKNAMQIVVAYCVKCQEKHGWMFCKGSISRLEISGLKDE
jgi:hypothetical protein